MSSNLAALKKKKPSTGKKKVDSPPASPSPQAERLSDDEFRNLIADSLLLYDQKKQEREKHRQEEERRKWQEKVGLRDYSGRPLLPRTLLTFANRFIVFIKILFLPKRKIEGDHATSFLLNLAVSETFRVTAWLLWIGAFLLVGRGIRGLAQPGYSSMSTIQNITAICLALLSVIFAQIFRMASIEVEKMKDRNYVADIFAAVAAVAGIIVAIVLR